MQFLNFFCKTSISKKKKNVALLKLGRKAMFFWKLKRSLFIEIHFG